MANFCERRVGAVSRSALLLGVSVAAVAFGGGVARAQTAPELASRVVEGSKATVVTPKEGGFTVTTTNINRRAGVAFNRFDAFEVARKELVTLVLPEATHSLVNVVSSAVRVDGTVTSRLVDASGTIGGNLFFLTNDGMFIGSGGLVNTGRLIVRGGSRDGKGLLDTDALNGADAFDAAKLLDYAPTSVVSVAGTINAPGGVDVSARAFRVASGGAINVGVAGFDALAPEQSAAVGIHGVALGAKLVRRNGGIAIVGVDEVSVAAGDGLGTAATTDDLQAGLLDARGYRGDLGPDADALAGGVDIASSGSIALGGRIVAWDGTATGRAADVTIAAEKTSNGVEILARLKGEDTSERTLEALHKIGANYFSDIAAKTGVTVTGSVVGDNVSIRSDAGSFTLADPEVELLNVNPLRAGIDFVQDYLPSKLLGVVGLDTFFARADARSEVTVGAGAAVNAKGNLTVAATSAATAEGFSYAKASGSTATGAGGGGVALSVGVALLKSTANVSAAGTLTAGETMSVTATNTASSSLNVNAISTEKAVAASVAYSDIDVDATVNLGGTVNAGRLVVNAANGQRLPTQGFVNAANVIAKDGAPGGGGAAVMDLDVNARADVTAAVTAGTYTVPTVGIPVAGTVTIHAANETNAVRNYSGSDVGTGIVNDLFAFRLTAGGSADQILSTAGGFGLDKVIAYITKLKPAEVDTSKKTFEVGAAIAVLNNSQAARASATGSIVAPGAVRVDSIQHDKTVRNNAKTAVSGARTTDGAAATLSGAFAYSDTDYVSTATVGGTVTSSLLAVNATTTREVGQLVEVPVMGEDDTKLKAVTGFASDLMGKLRFGATPEKGLFGSSAGAASATDSPKRAAISGSVAYADMAADTRAWINADTKITVSRALDVVATTDLALLSLSGIVPVGQIGIGTNGGSAVGLGAVYSAVSPTTVAGIGKGVVVSRGTNAQAVDANVRAEADVLVLSLAPQAGASNGIAGTGSFAINEVEGRTQATISKDARLDLGTGKLTLDALTAMEITAAGGSLSIVKADGAGTESTAAAIGVTGALNLVEFDTVARVGETVRRADNKADGAIVGDDDSGGGSTAVDAGIVAGNVAIASNATGMVNALSIAGTVTSTTKHDGLAKPGLGAKISRYKTLAGNIAGNLITKGSDTIMEAARRATDKEIRAADSAYMGAVVRGTKVNDAFGVAGSASVNISKLNTLVDVRDVSIKRPAAGAGTELSARAAEGVDLMAVSGGAAIAAGTKLPDGGKSVQVGGAFGLSFTQNRVATDLTNATVDGFAGVDLRAAANGLRIGSALGLAVDTTGTSSGAAAAGSVSVLIARDGARAAVTGGSITGAGETVGAVNVLAYNGMTMGAGAGAFGGSGANAVGAGVTVVDVQSPDGEDGAADARVVGSPVTAAGALTVRALTAARVAGVAMAGAVSTRSDDTQAAVAGALSFNNVDMDTTALLDVGKDGIGGVSVGGAVVVGAGDLGNGDLSKDQASSLANAGRSKTDTAGTSMLKEFKLDAGLFGSEDPVSTAEINKGTQILSIAVPLSGSRAQSAGMGIGWNQVDNDRSATIVGGADAAGAVTIKAGSLAVNAAEHTDIFALGVGVGISTEGVGIMGSLGANIVTGSSFAGIGKAADATRALKVQVTEAVDDTPNVQVATVGDGGMFGLAGALGAGKDAAIGFAVGINRITRKADAGNGGLDADPAAAGLRASLSGVTFTGTPDIDLSTEAKGRIIANAVGMAGSLEQAAIAGAASSNEITSRISAQANGLHFGTATPGDLAIRAKDSSAILSTGLVLGIGKKGGVAAGLSVNRIDADVTAALVVGGGEAVKVRNLLIDTVANAGTASFGMGAGGGESLGGAGSIAVNTTSSDVTSRLTQTGGEVIAAGSIGITARRDSTIDVAAGALGAAKQGLGLGASAVVNVLGGSATAEILGNGFGTIKAFTATDSDKDDERTLTGLRTGGLTDGKLPQYAALEDFGSQSLGGTGISIKMDDDARRGVVVNASSSAMMRTLAIAGGVVGNGAAIGVTGVVNTVTGTTTASVREADIDVGNGRKEGSDLGLDVRASTQTVGLTFAGALAGSGNVAVAAPFATDGFAGSTTATISGGKIKTAGSVSVDAIGNQASTALVVGGAGAQHVAAAVGGVSPRFDQTVTATIVAPKQLDTGRGSGVAVNAASSATSIATYSGIAGSVYASGAGAVVVATNENKTRASYVGAAASDGHAEYRVGADRMSITATGAFDSLIASASNAVSGGGALVGNGVGVVHRGEVSATASHLLYEYNEGALNIAALERVSIVPVVGGIAIGVSPFSGGASLGVIAVLSQSKVDAALLQSNIDAKTVTVDAKGYTQVDAGQYGVSGGGLGVGVNVTYIGVGSATDLKALTGPTTGSTSDNAVAEAAGSTGRGNRNLTAMADGPDTSGSDIAGQVGGALSDDEKDDAVGTDLARRAFLSIGAPGEASEARVRARVEGNDRSRLSVGETLSVTSEANLLSKSSNAQLAGGGAAGVGTVAITRNAAQSSAYVGNVDARGKTLNVTARTGEAAAPGASETLLSPKSAAEAQIYAGVAGGAALAVGVADVRLQSAALAEVQDDIRFDTATVKAEDLTSAKALVTGAAIGGNALNITVAQAAMNGTVQSRFGGQARGGSLSVLADAGGRTEATAYAGAGGAFLAGNAAVANASDTRTIRAVIAEDTISNVATTVRATATPIAVAKAIGVAVSAGVAAGASVANATVDGKVEAKVGARGFIDAPLTVEALVLKPAGEENLLAFASGSAGGLYAAVNATSAITSGTIATEAVVGADLDEEEDAAGETAEADDALILMDDIKVSARRELESRAEASGITAAGLLAVGVQRAEATSAGQTRAAMENVNKLLATDVAVDAEGIDRNHAVSQAGAGGAAAGLASAAVTKSTGAVVADLLPTNGDIRARKLTVTARSVADYRANADSLLATAVGGSGTTSDNTVNTSATVNVGSGADMRVAASEIRIAARDEVGAGSVDGGAIRGLGGGLAVGAGTVGVNDVTQNATVNINKGVTLRQLGGDFTQNTRATFIDASILTARTHGVSLRLGGVIQAPKATLDSTYRPTTAVTIGENVLIRAEQGIGIGTNVQQNITDLVAVQVYGASALGGGTSTNTSTVGQTVTVADGARIESLMDIRLSPGTSADGITSDLLQVASQTETLNETLVPLETEAGSFATLTGDNRLKLGQATIRSGRDLILGSTASAGKATAAGTGRNPYLKTVSQVSTSGKGNTNTAGSIALDGTRLVAGYLADRRVAIAADGRVTQTDVGDEYVANYGNANDYADRLGRFDVSQGEFSTLNHIGGRLSKLIADARATGLTVPENPATAKDPEAARRALNLAASTSTLIAEIAALYESYAAIEKIGGAPVRPATAIGGQLVNSQLPGPGIFAAGGTVLFDTGSLTGGAGARGGSVLANGGGRVTVTNQSGRDVIVGDIFVPMKPAGTVTFTGGATALPGNMARATSTVGTSGDGQISVTTGSTRSDIIVLGKVQNVGGSFSAKTPEGNYVQFGEVNAASFSAEAPNGLFSVSIPGDNGQFSQGLPLNFFYGNYGLSLWNNAAGNKPSIGFDFGNIRAQGELTAANAVNLLASYIATVRLGTAGKAGDFATLVKAFRDEFKYTPDNVMFDLFLQNAGRSSADGIQIDTSDIDPDGDGSRVVRSSTIWSSCLQACEFFSTDRDLGQAQYGQQVNLGFDGDKGRIFSDDHFFTTATPVFFSPVQLYNPTGAGLPSTYPASSAPASDKKYNAIEANQVVITASKVDISGTIVAGPVKQRSVVIENAVSGVDVSTRIPTLTTRDVGKLVAGSDDAVVDLRRLVSAGTNGFFSTGTPAKGNIGASFVKTQTAPDANGNAVGYIKIDDVLAGVGGSISITGKILNTNPLGGGKLKVLNGYGNISVENQTPYEMRLGTLNAGLSVDGRITLRDTGVITEWTNSVGGRVTETVYRNNIATTTEYRSNEGLTDATPIIYQPTGRVYYVWDDSRKVSRTVNPAPYTLDKDGDPEYRLDLHTVSPWQYSGEPGQAPQSGSYMDIDALDSPGEDITQALSTASVGNRNPGFVQILTGSVDESYVDNISFSKAAWNYRVELPTDATINVRSAAKATYPIAIVFDQGTATGGINVTSTRGGAITLTEAVTFGGGTVKLNTFGAVTQRDGGALAARNLDITAGAGIGALTGKDVLTAAPFRASINDGSVKAVAMSGNVALDLQAIGKGGLLGRFIGVDLVTAEGGSVSLTADAPLLGSNRGGGANIVARDAINLTSTGWIGGLDSTGVTGLKIASGNGVLNVKAAGDVMIDQVGTGLGQVLRVGSIETPGRVTLRVPGSVVAADATATVDTKKLAAFVTATRLLDVTSNCGILCESSLDASMRAEGLAAFAQIGKAGDADARARLTALFGAVPASREALETLVISRERKEIYRVRTEALAAFDLLTLLDPVASAGAQRTAAVDAALSTLNAVAALRREPAIGLGTDGRTVVLLDGAAATLAPGGALYDLAARTLGDRGGTLAPEQVRAGLQTHLDALLAPVAMLLPEALPDLSGLDADAARTLVGNAIGGAGLAAWAAPRNLAEQQAKATAAAVAQIGAIADFARSSPAIQVSSTGTIVSIKDAQAQTLAKGGALYDLAETTLRASGRVSGELDAGDVASGLQLYLDQLRAPLRDLKLDRLAVLRLATDPKAAQKVSSAILPDGLAGWTAAQKTRAETTLQTLFGTAPTDRATVVTGTLNKEALDKRLEGATWTRTQLDVVVPTSAFVPTADTQFETRTPAITAGSLSIIAGNSIGAFDQAKTFSYNAAGFMGPAEERDLATAYLGSAGPGDVQVAVSRGPGGQVDKVTFATRRDQPLTVSVAGTVNAVAATNPWSQGISIPQIAAPLGGNIFLTNTKALKIGTIISQSVGSDVASAACNAGSVMGLACDSRIRLVAPDVLGVTSGAMTLGSLGNGGRGLVMGGLVRIEASSGSIGGAEANGALAVDARALEVLRAEDAIRIVRRAPVGIAYPNGPRSYGGDLRLGDVYAGGRFQIDNPFGSLSVVRMPSSLETENRNSRVVVGSLWARAAGDIGSPTVGDTGIPGTLDVDTPWVERFQAGYDFGRNGIGLGLAPAGLATGNGYLTVRGDTRIGGQPDGTISESDNRIGARDTLRIAISPTLGGSATLLSHVLVGRELQLAVPQFTVSDERLRVSRPGARQDKNIIDLSALSLEVDRLNLITDRSIALGSLLVDSATVKARAGSVTVGGTIRSPGAITISGRDGVTVERIEGGSATLTATAGDVALASGRDLQTAALQGRNVAVGDVVADSLRITAADTGGVTLAGRVDVGRSLRAGSPASTGVLTVTGGSVAVAGLVSATNRVTIAAGSIALTERARIDEAPVLNLTATGNLSISANATFNRVGAASLVSGGPGLLTLGSFTNGGLLYVDAASMVLGQVQARSATLFAAQDVTISGTPKIADALSITAGTVTFPQDGLLRDLGALTIKADKLVGRAQDIRVASKLALTLRDTATLAGVEARDGFVTVTQGDLLMKQLTTTGSSFKLTASGAIGTDGLTAAGNLLLNAGGNLTVKGPVAMDGRTDSPLLDLKAGGTLTVNGGGITGRAAEARATLEGGRVAVTAPIRGMAVTVRSGGTADLADVQANTAADQRVTVTAGGAVTLGAVSAARLDVSTTAGAVRLGGRVQTGVLKVTAPGEIATLAVDATSAQLTSTASVIRFSGPVRVTNPTSPWAATLIATAADAITISDQISAQGGLTLTSGAIVTTPNGYLTDLDGMGAVTRLAADIMDVRFFTADTAGLAGPAVRVDARGRDGGMATEAMLHFATTRSINVTGFSAARGWIDALSPITVGQLTMRDWLRVGSAGSDALLSADGRGPATTRTVVTGGQTAAKLAVTPTAGKAPVITLNGKRK